MIKREGETIMNKIVRKSMDCGMLSIERVVPDLFILALRTFSLNMSALSGVGLRHPYYLLSYPTALCS